MRTTSVFARTTMTAALLFGTALMAAPALAAAPMAHTTAPGYYRMMLGDFEVTALSDGTSPMPVLQLLTGITPAQTEQALKADFQSPPYEMNFNAFIINTGTKLVLFDTGAGRLLGKDLGELPARIKASGYRPEQVDDIYITHMHPDHIGGLSEQGRGVFPNAVVHANRHDADFWLSKAQRDKAPAAQKEFFDDAMAALKPYIQAGRFKTFSDDAQLAPGIRAVPLAGHTPGHTAYMVESKGQKMLVWGDVIHVPAVQFAQPQVAIHFDIDSPEAVAARERILAEAAHNGYLIAGAHLSFPGLGHLRKEGTGYRWIPVSYTERH
ncbi:MAG TPA: MBL fold metallo-hydrolase [Rhodanobacter sp.]|nr:MBL fold metallo-hydrolase [Rhodanobacter sp.]